MDKATTKQIFTELKAIREILDKQEEREARRHKAVMESPAAKAAKLLGAQMLRQLYQDPATRKLLDDLKSDVHVIQEPTVPVVSPKDCGRKGK